jgi:catechol 2,3-dioxygenase-like lactoylglutathione lyase family enzyme
MGETYPSTQGIHHVGLTVSNLEASSNFFVKLLGWEETLRDNNYPAIFVTDGKVLITLWEVKSDKPIEFNKNNNIGLHHLALLVEDFDELESIYETLTTNGVKIEFPPEYLREGPAKHMMCYDPSGIRVEFICIPN